MTSIKKNLLYQTIYEVLILILPFFTSPYISRLFGAEKLGVFTYTYTIAYYYQMFGMLGIKFYGNRSIAEVRNDKTKLSEVFNEIFVIHVLLSTICLIVYVLYAIFMAENRVYALLQTFMVLSSVFDVSWLFFGLEEFKKTTYISSIIKILSVILIFGFVRDIDDFPIYILIMSGAQLVSSISLFIVSFRMVNYEKPIFRNLKKHIKPLLILFIPIFALSVFKYMDKIMLGAFGDKTELGYYENAEKVLNIPLSVVFSFGSVMLPRISNIISNVDKSAVYTYLKLSIKYMGGLSIAMAFGMAAISSTFAPVFWGNSFIKSGNIIALLSISLPFSTIASIIRNQDMIPNKLDHYYSYSIIAGAVVNLIINYCLIPRYQAIGVTIGTIIAEVVVCMSEIWLVRKNYNYHEILLQPILFFIPSVLMYVIVQMLGNILGIHVYTLIIQVLVGIIVFVICSFIMMFIAKDNDVVNLISTNKTNRKDK